MYIVFLSVVEYHYVPNMCTTCTLPCKHLVLWVFYYRDTFPGFVHCVWVFAVNCIRCLILKPPVGSFQALWHLFPSLSQVQVGPLSAVPRHHLVPEASAILTHMSRCRQTDGEDCMKKSPHHWAFHSWTGSIQRWIITSCLTATWVADCMTQSVEDLLPRMGS